MENPSIEGYWYFITFANDFSQYTHVGLCKSKDDAFPIFKWWRAHTEKETGKVLKILCMDGGGKYTVTLGSPRYGQGLLGPADIRSATRLPPQPLGPPGVPLGDMGVMMLIF